MLHEFFPTKHRYSLFCSGLKAKSKIFDTRIAAEEEMHRICAKYNIQVECTEYSNNGHERKYSNHNGVRFYINRI